MKILDLSYPDPLRNLACDEALLDACEDGSGAPVLRFWESPTPFVVLGFSNRAEAEIDAGRLAELGLEVYRRSSGGGAVVQGPGCLSYALVLPFSEGGRTIAETNRLVMERNRAALARAADADVRVDGHTDLCVDGRKVSGNAQRRKRSHLLFHGTFLLDFDARWMSALRLPALRPEYRRSRSHEDFCRNLGVGAEAVKRELTREWKAEGSAPAPPERAVHAAAARLGAREWIYRM